METCNCAFICPCMGSNLAATPTEGDCKVAVAMRIDKGEKHGVSLDGLAFVLLILSPGPMGDGNIKVGLIVDEKATDAQTGVEKRPITFAMDGMMRSVKAGELIDQALEGVPSPAKEGEPIYLDNTLHPASAKLALAHATRSRFNAFGIDWDDASGLRNGHFAPFSWSG